MQSLTAGQCPTIDFIPLSGTRNSGVREMKGIPSYQTNGLVSAKKDLGFGMKGIVKPKQLLFLQTH